MRVAISDGILAQMRYAGKLLAFGVCAKTVSSCIADKHLPQCNYGRTGLHLTTFVRTRLLQCGNLAKQANLRTPLEIPYHQKPPPQQH
jgi:hypothetical protein